MACTNQLFLTNPSATLFGRQALRFSTGDHIESWWRVLKHQWLYLNTLDTVSSVRKLVTFYVQEHNTRLPHSAFRGQTPDEMYFGTGNEIPGRLERARKAAREARKEVNRKNSCPTCGPLIAIGS
ncbi:integrase core domain-containing protein [Pirellulales bacterium]|nr:integrase core domain-containing protein [Pirellulales bacterium]